MKLRYFAPLILLICFGLLTSAQEDAAANTYTFADETRFEYPDDFFIYNEQDTGDGVFLMSNLTDVFIFTLLRATQINEGILGDLPAAIDRFVGDEVAFEAQDAELFSLQGRRIARFSHLVELDGQAAFERTVFAMFIEENSTIVMASIVPAVGADEIVEEERVLQMLASMRPAAALTGPLPLLDRSFEFDDGVVIDHRNSWLATPAAESVAELNSGVTSLGLITYSLEEIAEARLANDMVSVLARHFQPRDPSLQFDLQRVEFVTVGGRQIVRYAFEDAVGDDVFERLYYAILMENGSVVVASALPVTAASITEEEQVLEMLATLRLSGEALRTEALPLENAYLFSGGLRVNYPDNWRVEVGAEDRMTLHSIRSSLLLQPFSAAQLAERGNPSLKDFVLEFIETLELDLRNFAIELDERTLANGLTAAQIDLSAIAGPLVTAVALSDGSIVLTSLAPQAGFMEITAEQRATAQAIINSLWIADG